MTEYLDVLDSNGHITGSRTSRQEVHAKGLWHRAIHVYIFNESGQLLLQRRSLQLDHYPGALGISVSGHVDAGETGAQAAQREIFEEVGLEVARSDLQYICTVRQEATLSPTYIDRQFNDLFLVKYHFELSDLDLQAQEVQSVELVEWTDFTSRVKTDDDSIAPVYKQEVATLEYLLGHSRNWLEK